MQVRKGGAWRTITSGQAFINGAWRQIINGKAYHSGWRSVCNFTPVTPTPTPTPPPTGTMTLAVSPSSTFNTATSTTVVSSTITATPSGGAAPYTYVWSFVSTDGSSFTITAPTLANTQVRVTGLATGDSASCSIHCVCNDSTGLTATSASVNVTLSDVSGGIIP